MTRILVIDDELLNHQLVAKALESLDCQLSFAEDGTSGLARARTLRPDVIITDVMMPDINGYEVTRLLRREVEFHSMPILALTPQAGLKDKPRAFAAASDAYLRKPFEPDEPAARVSELPRRADLITSG